MSYFLVYDFDYSMEIKRVHEHRKNKQANKKKWAVISWKEDISCSFNLFLCFIFFLWYYVTCENNQWEKKKKKQNTLASISPLILGGRDRFYMSTSVRARCVSPTYIRSHVSKKKKSVVIMEIVHSYINNNFSLLGCI